MKQGEYIKVHVSLGDSFEHFWATVTDINKCYARVDNIPISSKCSLHDIIEFDLKTLNFVNIIKYVTTQIAVKHPFQDTDEGRQKCRNLLDFLKKRGCYLEVMVGELAMLAVPYEWTEEQIEKLFEEIPYELKLEEMEVE